VGLRSTSTVAYYLRDLEEKGQLDRTRERSRGVVLKDRETADAVPLLGRIAAGTPILATEHVEDMVTVPSEWFSARVDFALKVSGDSMIGAGIHDGDIAFIHQQPSADDGDIVAALLDDEATLKRLRRRSGQVELHAENPQYAPIVAGQVTILGRLVGIVRTF
jgi:repressor LexA